MASLLDRDWKIERGRSHHKKKNCDSARDGGNATGAKETILRKKIIKMVSWRERWARQTIGRGKESMTDRKMTILSIKGAITVGDPSKKGCKTSSPPCS